MIKARRTISGFSLTELMVVMAVGLLIFSGVIGLLIASDETVDDTVQRGELQENGRIAMSMIARDIMMSGYLGRYTGKEIHQSGADTQAVTLNSVDGNKVAISGTDCIGGGMNNATFFIENSDFHFRTLWGMNVESSNIFSDCISDAKTGSDAIQVKRAMGQEVISGNEDGRRIYLISTENQAVFYAGSDPTPSLEDGLISEYQHHVYYVAEETRGDNLIPVLRRKYLYKAESDTGAQAKLKAYSLVEGIERLGFMYGIDSDGDSIVNYYEPADNLTREHWEKDGFDIIAVRIHMLVRAIRPSSNVTNTNTYDLGGYTVTVDDKYRRVLMTQTVSILNAGEYSWRS